MNTSRVTSALAKSWDAGKVTALIDRYFGLINTKEFLLVALRMASLDHFTELVARIEKPIVTERMLGNLDYKSAIRLENLVILLNRVGESSLTSELMAFVSRYRDERVVEAMLSRCPASNVTEALMLEAVASSDQIFDLTLQHGGKVTDTVLDEVVSNGSVHKLHTLLDRGYGFGNSAKRLKLAALSRSKGDVLGVLLDHTDKVTVVNEMAGLIHEVSKVGTYQCLKKLLDHAKHVRISQDMIFAATFDHRGQRFEKLRMMLDRTSQVEITEDMLIVAACDRFNGIKLIRLFLARDGEAKISNYVLLAAARNRFNGPEILQLLLEQNRMVVLTEDVVICAAQYFDINQLEHALECSEVKVITVRLLKTAATNIEHGAELVRLLLARAEITTFPEDVLIEAVANHNDGIELIHILEETFGRIEVTENLMLKCIHRAGRKTAEFLLARTDIMQITKKVLLRAIRDSNDSVVKALVAQKSLHIPVSPDILQIAAKSYHVGLFQFFWNRWGRRSVPEDLITTAMHRGEVLELLLYESDHVEIGQETVMAIAALWNDQMACRSLDFLLEQGLQIDTTKGLPETLLANGGIELKCSPSTKVRLSSGTKVTEETFRNAASLGHEQLLEKLADLCRLETVPKKWLDIAQLYNAAGSGNHVLLKKLLASGVAPDTANPYGGTPLVKAVKDWDERILQTLLSAGASPDGGPGLLSSPLCNAAWYDQYDMVRILVDAGASIDFKDGEGKTPSMLAKEEGNILILKYLDQCQKERDKAGQEPPKSAYDYSQLPHSAQTRLLSH